MDRVTAPEKFEAGKKKTGPMKRYHAVDKDGLPMIGEKVLKPLCFFSINKCTSSQMEIFTSIKKHHYKLIHFLVW